MTVELGPSQLEQKVTTIIVEFSQEDQKLLDDLAEGIREEQARLEIRALKAADKNGRNPFFEDNFYTDPQVDEHLPFLAFREISEAFKKGLRASITPIKEPNGKHPTPFVTIRTYVSENDIPWEKARKVLASLGRVGQEIGQIIESGKPVVLKRGQASENSKNGQQ